MLVKGTSYNVEAVQLLTLDEFVKQHENLPFYKGLDTKTKVKELKDTFLQLGGTIKK